MELFRYILPDLLTKTNIQSFPGPKISFSVNYPVFPCNRVHLITELSPNSY